MDDTTAIVVFKLDERQYGLLLAVVERVFRVVEITPLPGAPESILGAINVHGEVVAVVDLRRHLGLPPREPALSDELLLVRAAGRTLALLVDEVVGVIECRQTAQVRADRVAPGVERIGFLVKQADGLLLVPDLDRLLSQDASFALGGSTPVAEVAR